MYTPVTGSNKTLTASSIEICLHHGINSCSGVSGNIFFNSSIPGSYVFKLHDRKHSLSK